MNQYVSHYLPRSSLDVITLSILHRLKILLYPLFSEYTEFKASQSKILKPQVVLFRHTLSYAFIAFHISRKMLEIFTVTYGHIMPQIFPMYFGQPLICPNWYCDLRQLEYETKIANDCFAIMPNGWGFSHWTRSNKDKPREMRLFNEASTKAKILTITWWRSFLRNSKAILFPPEASRLLVFHCYLSCMALGLKGHHRAMERRLHIEQVKTWESLFLPFFLNKSSSDCFKALVNFQSSIKVNFANILTVFLRRTDIWRFTTTEVVSSPWLLLIRNVKLVSRHL